MKISITIPDKTGKNLDKLVSKRNMEKGCPVPPISRSQVVAEAIERLIDFEAMGAKRNDISGT